METTRLLLAYDMDPLEGLKRLPWPSLVQVAGLTGAIVLALEIVVSLLGWQLRAVQILVVLVQQSILSPIFELIYALGIGALAIVLCERWFTNISLRSGSLWALSCCLILVLWLKSILLELGLDLGLFWIGSLFGLSHPISIGIIVGIFWKARAYWYKKRSY